MSTSPDVIAGVGLADRSRKEPLAGAHDLAQSSRPRPRPVHVGPHVLVSSILVSKDFMWTITKMFEGSSLRTGVPRDRVRDRRGDLCAPGAACVSRHCGSSGGLSSYRTSSGIANCSRTRHDALVVQVVTGFALFFLAAVHLYQMLMHPGDIGPLESADRVWSGRWWADLPRHALLRRAARRLVGLYRRVKWGWFEGKDANASRKRLKTAKWALTVFFLVLGLATLAAYMKIATTTGTNAGARYTPAWLQDPPKGRPPFWWPSWLKEAPK